MPGTAGRPRARRRAASGVRLGVIVENGEYLLQNKGDLALLAVTVRRLRDRWPQGKVGVLTNAPALLRAYEPEAFPVPYDHGRAPWNRALPTPPRLSPRVAGAFLDLTEEARSIERRVSNRVRRHLPRSALGMGETREEASSPGPPALRREGGQIPDEVEHASLVIAMGGGYLTDVDLLQSHRTLTLLDYAVTHGLPTAMLGQGIGPMTDVGLLAHAREVLPRVDLIALRERRRGPEILRSLGVSDSRLVVTGDDAIELAHGVRTPVPALTGDIGVCLRIAGYSPVAQDEQAEVGRALRALASAHHAGLRPLIVSEYLSEDRRATLPLTDGYRMTRPPLPRYARPVELAREVGRCRVIVTGAYHVAVFALAQGIPVVGLSTSRYYDDKLAGLASMFGSGIEVVRLDEAGLATSLTEAVSRAWEGAAGVRAPLLLAAEEQIELSRAAFDRACRLAEA